MTDSMLVRVARLQLQLARIHAKVAAAELLVRAAALKMLEPADAAAAAAETADPQPAPPRPEVATDEMLAAYA